MNAHFMRHKERVARFSHRTFAAGTTMPLFPLARYNKHRPGGLAIEERDKLARALLETRRIGLPSTL